MKRFWLVSIMTAPLILAVACKQTSTNDAATSMPDQTGVSPSCVVFDIAPEPTPSGTKDTTHWLATYSSAGRRAQFRIQLSVTSREPSTTRGLPDISFGHGKFVAVAGSDASILLPDLAKVLEAKVALVKVKRVHALPFKFVILGNHQSHAPDGGFFAEPKGDWMPMKIFLGPPGDHEGQVFLNFNPVLRKGEFSIKDADCGNIVVRELAKVL